MRLEHLKNGSLFIYLTLISFLGLVVVQVLRATALVVDQGVGLILCQKIERSLHKYHLKRLLAVNKYENQVNNKLKLTLLFKRVFVF